MTIGCFPAPVPGELLYGTLARHRFLVGSPDAATHATELFGRRAAVASFDLPCRLEALAARLPPSCGLDGEALLSHTLYPFYAAFQSDEGRSAVQHDMLVSEVPNAHHRLGVAAFRIKADSALRYCVECVAEQKTRLGFSTWMIMHQLPGVPVCAVHGCMLSNSLVTRTSAGRHGYVSPSHVNCPHETARPLDAASVDLLVDLARRASAIAMAPRSAHALDHWRSHYIGRLGRAGLMRSPQMVDQGMLNDGLETHWGAALRYLPAPCSVLGEQGWAAAMVRTHRKAMHPLLHLLMEGFLDRLEAGGSAVGRSMPLATAYEPKPAVFSTNPDTGRRRRVDWQSLDVDLARRVETVAGEVRAVTPPIRVTAAEIERRIAKGGWFGKRRLKVPDAVAALMAAEETLDAFRTRRVEHWHAVLGPDCRAWEIMRAAGLRSDQLPMIRRTMEMRSLPGSAGH